MISREKNKTLNNLKTAKGQLEAVIRMLEEDRYCVDISKQILAIQAILKKSNFTILNQHVKNCVKDAMVDGKGDEMVDEIFDIIGKYAK